MILYCFRVVKIGCVEHLSEWIVFSDTLVKIGGRLFYVLRTADFNKKRGIRERRLIAFTYISEREPKFHYKLMSRQYDSVLISFFDRSLANLNTIRLKDGSGSKTKK